MRTTVFILDIYIFCAFFAEVAHGYGNCYSAEDREDGTHEHANLKTELLCPDAEA